VGNPINDGRPVSNWVIAIEIGVIVGPAAVVVIAIAVRVIAPARVAGADEE
jgi:hypothetical protein